jgi:nucleotide-binding universal stress UspA family protein
MKRRKVLIPLDGSDFSRQILRVVQSFFEPDGVELVLFRAAFPPVLPSESIPTDMMVGGIPLTGSYDAYNRAVDASYAALEKEREQYRLQLADELQPEMNRLRELGYAVSAQIDYGDPAQCIIDYVNDAHVDLVAMATHGRSGFGRIVLGSVAERVLRSVSVPVLLMRPAAVTHERPAASDQLARSLGSGRALRVAVATDGSPGAQRALDFAAGLTELMQTRLSVFVIAGEHAGSAQAQQIMAAAHQAVRSVAPRPEFIPLVGFTEEVLLQRLEKEPVDLLILGPFADRGAGSAAAIGPTAQRLVQQIATSVLVVKGHAPDVRRVLVCADVDDEAVVTVAAQVAALLRARFDLVHVISPAAANYLAAGQGADLGLDEILTQGTHLSTVAQGWIERVAQQGFDRNAIHIRKGTMPEAALELAHSGDYDLICVGSRSSPGHFPGSAANSLVRYAESTVLVVKTRP